MTKFDLSKTPHYLEVLTRRQIETIRYIVDGYKNREIAEFMGIGIKTVDTHRTYALKMLGLKSNVALVHYAIRYGIIKVEVLETKMEEKIFQGPGTGGHSKDCGCAACRNFDD